MNMFQLSETYKYLYSRHIQANVPPPEKTKERSNKLSRKGSKASINGAKWKSSLKTMKKAPWEIKGVVNQVVLDLFKGQMKKEMRQELQINQGLKNDKCVFLYWKLSQSLFSLSPSRWRHSSFNNWKPDKCHRGRIYFNSSTHPKISKYRTDASVLTRNPLTSYLWPNKKKWWKIFWDKSGKIIRDRMKLKWEENFYSELHFFQTPKSNCFLKHTSPF